MQFVDIFMLRAYENVAYVRSQCDLVRSYRNFKQSCMRKKLR